MTIVIKKDMNHIKFKFLKMDLVHVCLFPRDITDRHVEQRGTAGDPFDWSDFGPLFSFFLFSLLFAFGTDFAGTNLIGPHNTVDIMIWPVNLYSRQYSLFFSILVHNNLKPLNHWYHNHHNVEDSSNLIRYLSYELSKKIWQ